IGLRHPSPPKGESMRKDLLIPSPMGIPPIQISREPLSKKALQAVERQRPDVARARRRWIREQGMLDPACLVFIDETAVSTTLSRLRGRAPRGVRVIGSVPLGRWETSTFVV